MAHVPQQYDVLDLVDSMETVEFHTETEIFRTTFDGVRDSAAMAVIALVGTVLDRDPLDLPPLHFTVDTDELEALVSHSYEAEAGPDSVSFDYVDLGVTVSADGTVEADPTAPRHAS